ncbi:STAS domain-containing protein [Streptomyces sp. NPDC047097]|uniref:STAS domain-containing protein n=1 Tax=Streptomyces sp. NPDC047097 TaxID=3155260 RepID=UPI0033CDBFF2
METTEPYVLRLPATVGPGDVPGLCAGLAALMDRADPGSLLVCDAGGLARPTLAAVEALARLRLTALRRGRALTVRGAGAELRALLGLAGLAALLGPPGPDGEPGTESGPPGN